MAVDPNGFFAVHQSLCVSLLTASLFYRMEYRDCCSFVSSNGLRCVNFAHTSDSLMNIHVHHLITKCLSFYRHKEANESVRPVYADSQFAVKSELSVLVNSL